MVGETAFVSLLVGSILFAQLALSGSFALLTRQFWIDEIITFVLVSDRSVVHSIGALIGGLDTNPPAYHLLSRAFTRLVGRVNEVSLRSFALLSIVAALTGLYVNLRQVYAPAVALTVLLALLAHPLVLRCAFEARMYGPWLAASVWFAFFLNQSGNSPGEPWLQILLACTALVTTSMHTLGLLGVVLMSAAHVLFAPWQPSWIAVAPAGIASVLWMPYLKRQNDANPVTWVAGARADNVVSSFHSLLFSRGVASVLLLGAGVAPFLASFGQRSGADGLSNIGVLAGLAGLACMPVALVVLSVTVQPLLVDRYALPTVASFAPAIAVVISGTSDLWLGVLCIPLFFAGAHQMHRLHVGYRDRDRERSNLFRAIRLKTGAEPVMFESLHDLAVVHRYAPDLAARSFMLDFELDELADVEAVRIANRNQTRLLNRFYSWPHLMAWKTLRSSSRFFLVGWSLKPELSEYPGFANERIETGLYELTARSSADDALLVRNNSVRANIPARQGP